MEMEFRPNTIDDKTRKSMVLWSPQLYCFFCLYPRRNLYNKYHQNVKWL